MELTDAVSPINGADKNLLKEKKRKYSAIKDKCDSDLFKLAMHMAKKKKIKKKLSSECQIYNQSSNKYLQYKNTDYYTSVIANPESLQSTPQIFKKNKFTNAFRNYSDSLLSLIPVNCFKTDISQRFNHLTLSCQDIVNCINAEAIKKLNITDNNKNKREGIRKKRIIKKSLLKKCKNADLKIKNKKNESSGKAGRNTIEESNLSQTKLFTVKEKKGVIIHMHHKSLFSFHGEIKITVLAGEIEILGYSLSHKSSKNSVDVYSPNFYTALVVETKLPKENKSKMDMKSILQNYISEADVQGILTDFDSNDAVLLIEQINSVFGIVINKYCDYPLFPKDLEDISSKCQTVKSLQSVFNWKLSLKGKHFKKNFEWDNIPLGNCTVLCGGKGVGKSTLLKYYVNKFLAQGEKVLCLDFDVGQPEFTPSGCVSAVVVDQPLLGPNFTHVINPHLMMYFGDIDVAQNPSKYVECVKYVIESCKKNVEFVKMKWFVNTMGFNKGLGVYLMITILKLLQPNTVIQIQGFYKNNYPFLLTPNNLNSRAGFKSMPLEDVQVSHDVCVVQSYAMKNEFGKKGGELSLGALKPRQLRDIMSLSYFSKMVSAPYYNFNAVQPYLISFSKLYLGIHYLIDFNDILKAFNANIVSLLNFKPDEEEVYSVDSDEDDYFKIVVKPKPTPCLGIGLVRGIDKKEKKIYIVTPVSLEILNKVNCLCLERISPPHSMFIKQETVEGHSMYTTTTSSANFIQRVKRIFHGSATTQNEEKPNV